MEADEFISTKEVLPWRAIVYRKAAGMVDHGIKVEKKAGPGEIIIVLDEQTLKSEIHRLDQHHIAVEISGPKNQQQNFSRTDAELVRRINYQRFTFNPLLIPFVWGTRNCRRVEERAIRRKTQ